MTLLHVLGQVSFWLIFSNRIISDHRGLEKFVVRSGPPWNPNHHTTPQQPRWGVFSPRFSSPKFPTKIKPFPLDLGLSYFETYTPNMTKILPNKTFEWYNLFHLRCLELETSTSMLYLFLWGGALSEWVSSNWFFVTCSCGYANPF